MSEFFDGDTLPAGLQLLADGLKIGAGGKPGLSLFCRSRGVASEVEWKLRKAAAGEIEWSMIMGLASLPEQIDGLKQLNSRGEATGVVLDRGLVIPNWVTGLPEELRERAPKGTSFVLGGRDEHVAIAEAAPIMPCFNDWHIGSPAALANTIAAVEAGGSYSGVLAQYVWDLPYVESDVDTVAENIKAIGVIASKCHQGFVVDSYMDDGMPAQFADNASLVGYAMLEHYVVDTLCGARYATGFGQLISDIPTKIAIWLALDGVLAADHPPVSYVYGNTIDASESLLTSNFGVSAAEVMAFAATERRYRTGAAILPNPATEALRVPTVQEIFEVHSVARKAATKAKEFEGILDFRAIEALRDELVEVGRSFFANTIWGMAEMGIDVEDPLQLLLGMRRLGASRLESLFHPGSRDATQPNGVVPVSRTEFTRRAAAMVESELEAVRDNGSGSKLRGRGFVVASGDTHAYGLYVLGRVLGALGADVIDLGTDTDPEEIAATLRGLRDDTAVAISTHNGQCLGYGERLMSLLPAGYQGRVFMGGRLNAIPDGRSEPEDASPLLRQMGIHPCARVADMVRSFAAALS